MYCSLAYIFGEMDLKGGYGILLKELQKSVDTLIALLQQPVNQPQQYAPKVPTTRLWCSRLQSAAYQQPIPVATHNPTKAATASLILDFVESLESLFQ